MAIKINQKKGARQSILGITLFISLLLLTISFLISYFYINNSLEKIKKNVQKKDQALIVTPEEKKLEDNVSLAQERINIFSDLINKHYDISKMFNLLENDCLPKVQFSDFRFEKKGNLVSISGITDNFITLGQQVNILRKEPLISKVKISEISENKEKTAVNFTITLTLDQKVFQ